MLYISYLVESKSHGSSLDTPVRNGSLRISMVYLLKRGPNLIQQLHIEQYKRFSL